MKNLTRGPLGMLAVALVTVALAMPVSAARGGDVLTVGPGREYATIQKAVDAAAPRSTILVYPRSDVYAESVHVTTDNLQLIAEGDGVTVRAPTKACFWVEADGVTIRGFDIAFGADFAPGILFEGSRNTFAENYLYLSASAPGINALVSWDDDGGSDYNTIESNTIDQSDLGIIIGAMAPDAINTGNVIQGNTLLGIAQTPIGIANGKGFRISGNQIQGAPLGHCIAVGSPGPNEVAQGHHTIVDNTMGSCAGNGISLYAYPGTVVTHNRISGNSIQTCGEDCIALEASEGATMSHNSVLDNSASFSDMCGIVLGAYGNALDVSVSDNLVRGNLVYRNLGGVCLVPGADGNRVLNNVAQDHQGDGFVVSGSGNLLVGNSAHDNAHTGIEVQGDNNTIVNNTALHNGIFDLEDWGDGNKWRNNTYESADW